MPQIIKVGPFSDGDPTHRPNPDQGRTLVQYPEIYLEKLATLWVESQGLARSGMRYFLEKLPDGYAVFERPRPSNPKHVDKWLYGNPKGWYDSPNRFFPHFKRLMESQTTEGCPCTVCTSPTTVARPISVAVKNKPGRPKLSETERYDPEGNIDVYRVLIDRLKKEGSLETAIEETTNMDWRAERVLPNMIDETLAKPSWLPRTGELVLFVRSLKEGREICLDKRSMEYRIYDTSARTFESFPQWEAGVVTQVATEPTRIEDLMLETSKSLHVASGSGFRVEPLPGSEWEEMERVMQHTYLPLHLLRPFNFWYEFLHGIPDDERHPTIFSVARRLSTVSLLEKYYFGGTWPEADISCKGVYIGAELVLSGDVVRLAPRVGGTVTDVLQITGIQLHLSNLETASDDDTDEYHPYNSAIRVQGKGFTLDSSRAAMKQPVKPEVLPATMKGYGDWYYLHGLSQSVKYPFRRVLDRLKEHEAILLWIQPDDSEPRSTALDVGRVGLNAGRSFSYKALQPVTNGNDWFWADTRAQALGLRAINGIETARYDKTRNPTQWRKELRLIDGVAGAKDKAAVQAATNVLNLRRFSLLNNAHLEVQDETDAEAVEATESQVYDTTVDDSQADVAADETSEDDLQVDEHADRGPKTFTSVAVCVSPKQYNRTLGRRPPSPSPPQAVESSDSADELAELHAMYGLSQSANKRRRVEPVQRRD